MISYQEAKRLADEHLRAEGSPWVARHATRNLRRYGATRNLRYGVWVVAYRDPTEPDEELTRGGLVVEPAHAAA